MEERGHLLSSISTSDYFVLELIPLGVNSFKTFMAYKDVYMLSDGEVG